LFFFFFFRILGVLDMSIGVILMESVQFPREDG
jgi:hypothetical protein